MTVTTYIYIYLVGRVDGSDCNYIYGRDVDRTGKFCAGQGVDACQVKKLWIPFKHKFSLIGQAIFRLRKLSVNGESLKFLTPNPT